MKKMFLQKKIVYYNRRASVHILAVIFILIFSTLAVSMVSLSGTNVQIASNHHDTNVAFAAAQSGQEAMRYLFSRLLISSSTPTSEYLSEIIVTIQKDISENNISGISLSNNGLIPRVVLNSTNGQSFFGRVQIDASDPTILQCSITGQCNSIYRTITVEYYIRPYEFPIFNYGLATKGPLNFPGNPTISAVNSAWEADVFVESLNDPIALSVIGNTNFDGNVNIGNQLANVDFQGDVIIADEHGQTAIDNHVSIGMETPQFPIPDTNRFLQYVTGDIIDPSWDLSKGMTLTNAKIKAGTNPVFEGGVIIEGILFIESPNKVTFGSNVDLRGIIVADGNVNYPDPNINRIDFLRNFASVPYPPGSEFDAIRKEEGSSIIAPGYDTTFSGNFSALEGVVAVSGVHFSGNMAAEIKGTIINYSDSPTIIEGNASMNFDRENSTKVPAGYDLYRELSYNPSTYSEVATDITFFVN